MFGKKLASSPTLRWSILLVVVLALLVVVFVAANAPLAPSSHQVASGPVFGTCAPGPAYGASPASPKSSRSLTTRCPPLVQPNASWGS